MTTKAHSDDGSLQPWMAGHVLMGTCGWSDESLARCGKFYPKGACSSAVERLRHYSRHFPSVEVDTSTYAIPTADTVAKWAGVTPEGFTFHVKAFGIFCATAVQISSLPRAVREMPCMATLTGAGSSARVSADRMPAAALDSLWDRFHAALAPLRSAKKLGLIIFQFHLSFEPSAANRAVVVECRRRLGTGLGMAVEFRHRGWTTGALTNTLTWLRELQISLIAADDLRHEVLQPDRAQTGPPPGCEPERLPIALHVTNPSCLYVRVHRRHGIHRLLSDSEMSEWALRLQRTSLLQQGLKGPVYFLWGTDHEDQPIRNAMTLARLLASSRASDASEAELAADAPQPDENCMAWWQRRCRQAAPISSLFGMLKQQQRRQQSAIGVDGEKPPMRLAAEAPALSPSEGHRTATISSTSVCIDPPALLDPSSSHAQVAAPLSHALLPLAPLATVSPPALIQTCASSSSSGIRTCEGNTLAPALASQSGCVSSPRIVAEGPGRSCDYARSEMVHEPQSLSLQKLGPDTTIKQDRSYVTLTAFERDREWAERAVRYNGGSVATVPTRLCNAQTSGKRKPADAAPNSRAATTQKTLSSFWKHSDP